MTSTLDSYRKQSSVEAKAILTSGVPTLDALTSALDAMPFRGNDALSTAESSFVATFLGGNVEQPNEVVDAAYVSVRNALVMGAEHTRVLERFVGLHVPQMGEIHSRRNILLCLIFRSMSNKKSTNTLLCDCLLALISTNMKTIINAKIYRGESKSLGCGRDESAANIMRFIPFSNHRTEGYFHYNITRMETTLA